MLNFSARYINSGHLIVNRKLFNELGGFNPKLVTGEDLDFSHRAVSFFGARIINNKRLSVIHLGYPNDIKTFIKREIWHGTLSGSLPQIKELSKTQISSILFIALHGFLIISALSASASFSLLALAGIFSLCLISAFIKYKHHTKTILINTAIFYAYYIGRSIAIGKLFINSLLKRTGKFIP